MSVSKAVSSKILECCKKKKAKKKVKKLHDLRVWNIPVDIKTGFITDTQMVTMGNSIRITFYEREEVEPGKHPIINCNALSRIAMSRKDMISFAETLLKHITTK